MSDSWWEAIQSERLAQGDLLPDCCLPVFANPTPGESEFDEQEIDVVSQRLIVVTQSCDIENNKVEIVALCPIHTMKEFAESNPHYGRAKNWERVRRGQIHALHMIASPDASETNTDSLVVDFGQIVSLPIDYLSNHAASFDQRWRLNSPFLEHFSQAFARFFMRVGLPSSIAPFK